VKRWDFDVWKYDVDSLIRMVIAMFSCLDLFEKFQLPLDRMINFMLDLCKSYRDVTDVPYHNFFHAIDVTQTVFLMIWRCSKIRGYLSSVDQMALLLAALCHDVDHSGQNNTYHIKAQTPLGMLYKDRSVLETHHCSRSIIMLSAEDNNIFANMTDEDKTEIWKLLLPAILATDMSQHFAVVSQFESVAKSRELQVHESEDRKLLSNMILKCADISNVVKPFSIAKRWAEILCSEFFHQGDLERQKGLPVSPLMDRENVVLAQMQLGFINSIAIPIFQLLSSYFPELKADMFDSLLDNKQEWTRILQEIPA